MKRAALAAAVAAAAVATATAAPVFAQQQPATLTLSAESEVQTAPDQAVIGAGVVTTATEAGAALADNSARMNRVMAALRQAGVESRDIQTSGLSVRPQYRYQQNEAPVLTGFEAVNRVEVRLRDGARVGAVVDALVAAGGNQIDGPSFTVADPEPLLDRARADAVRKALKRATLYAEAAGLRVERVLSIEEGGGQRPVPPMPRMMAMAQADSAPVAAGEVGLVASVTVTFALQPR